MTPKVAAATATATILSARARLLPRPCSSVDDVGHCRRRSAAKPEQSTLASLVVSCGTIFLQSRKVVARHTSTLDVPMTHRCIGRSGARKMLQHHLQPLTPAAQEIVSHETSRLVGRHPLALHCVPRSQNRRPRSHEQCPSALRIHSEGHAKGRRRGGGNVARRLLGLLRSPFGSVPDVSATATKVVIGILISVEDSVWIVRSRN
ncbi:MAG: hypothetical protein RIR10_174 [Planctomycetota bacterium]|jgi:hypothetical protein